MSGIYLLVVVGAWVGATWLLFRGWRRWRGNAQVRRRTVDLVCAVLALIWIGSSAWYGGGRKVYYDMLVSRMCEEDGGVKVYETVKLPVEKFERSGFINFYRPTKKENALGPEYLFRTSTSYYRREDPAVWRDHYEVIRRADGNLLGAATSYSRRGGDFPGPWHPSSFGCPEHAGDASLVKLVFLKVH